MQPLSRALALRTAAAYAVFPEVEAIALVGSQTDLLSDAESDLNLALFLACPLDLALRQAVVAGFARQGPGLDPVQSEFRDTWFDKATGRCVDVQFHLQHDVAEYVTDLLENPHVPATRLSTRMLHVLSACEILFDRSFWLENMRGFVSRPFPQSLQRALIDLHTPFVVPGPRSLLRQLEIAQKRQDELGLITACSSFCHHYFEVLFALNGVYFPGNKRLTHQVLSRCEILPPEFHTLFHFFTDSRPESVLMVAKEASLSLEALLKVHRPHPVLL